jgi:DNA ligase-associated metallophosphoesterase
MNISVAGEKLDLLPEKAIFWPGENILILSDVHIGKSESYQALGVPLPSGAHYEDLEHIERLLAQTGVAKVYILGDLIHHKTSWTPQIQQDLADFFQRHRDVEWTLLIGNHERGSIAFLEKLPLRLISGDHEHGPFLFSHGHDSGYQNSALFLIQGHIHPVVRLSQGAIRLRLPCFVMDLQRLILPAFGVLTGGYEMHPARGRRIFALTPESVFEVPATPRDRKPLEN